MINEINAFFHNLQQKMPWITWVFSGVGASVMVLFFTPKTSQQQRSGNNSINLQASKNITINTSSEEKHD